MIGHPFIELEQVESTNNYAIGLLHAGMAQHGLAVFAHRQTAGKGQRTKRWQGAAFKNIAISIVVQPAGLSLSKSFLLSMAAAIATHRLFSAYAGDETKIKWPNDIYWRDRKAAGILIENSVQGTNWKWSVVGIGININQTFFPDLGTKAVSLKQITGKEWQPVELAKQLCTVFHQSLTELYANENLTISEYKKSLYRLQETVTLKKGETVFSALVKDVTVGGHLIVEGEREESFSAGEVEWIG